MEPNEVEVGPIAATLGSRTVTEAPGGALDRGQPVAGDCLLKPLVLVHPRWTVAACRAADPRMGRVEAPLGAGAENVAFEKDGGPSVWQETAAGRLDDHYRTRRPERRRYAPPPPSNRRCAVGMPLRQTSWDNPACDTRSALGPQDADHCGRDPHRLEAAQRDQGRPLPQILLAGPQKRLTKARIKNA